MLKRAIFCVARLVGAAVAVVCIFWCAYAARHQSETRADWGHLMYLHLLNAEESAYRGQIANFPRNMLRFWFWSSCRKELGDALRMHIREYQLGGADGETKDSHSE